MVNPDNIPPRKRKRARTVISCTECHRRKQKVRLHLLLTRRDIGRGSAYSDILLLLQCDRQHPCGNCTLRSASHLCQYESKSSANNAPTSPVRGYAPSRNLGGESPDSPGEMVLGTKDVPGEFGYIRSSANTALGVLEKVLFPSTLGALVLAARTNL